jgi:hypothetical protein
MNPVSDFGQADRLQAIVSQHLADNRMDTTPPVPTNERELLIAALQNCHAYLTGRNHNRGDAIVRVKLALFAVGKLDAVTA